jgi:hypothetical protein
VKHWNLLTAALVISISASAQTSPRERISVRDRPSIGPLTTVIFNDGKYALVENKTVSDLNKNKDARANCPTGMKAVSAGFAAASGSAGPADFRVNYSYPTETGTGWVIYASHDGKGNTLASDSEWELRIQVVCIKLS